MNKLLAIAAVAGILGFATLPVHAQVRAASSPAAQHVVTHSPRPHVTPVQQTAGKKCWYVLDVLLCDD